MVPEGKRCKIKNNGNQDFKIKHFYSEKYLSNKNMPVTEHKGISAIFTFIKGLMRTHIYLLDGHSKIQ